jgi:hypothetical protein
MKMTKITVIVKAVFTWYFNQPRDIPESMMKNKPIQKNLSAHFLSAYMPSTALLIDPSGPRIAKPGPKIIHLDIFYITAFRFSSKGELVRSKKEKEKEKAKQYFNVCKTIFILITMRICTK